jgi:hypothetical protein
VHCKNIKMTKIISEGKKPAYEDCTNILCAPFNEKSCFVTCSSFHTYQFDPLVMKVCIALLKKALDIEKHP